MNFYTFINKVDVLQASLQDERSRDIFWARLRADAEPDMDRAERLITLSYPASARHDWHEAFEKIEAEKKKIVIYGAGETGRTYQKLLTKSGKDFYAFCDKGRAGEMEGNKPIISPEELFTSPDSYYVIIASLFYHSEILRELREHFFPEHHILRFFDIDRASLENEYFEFLQFYKQETAFVDAGSFDGRDSVRFSQRCANYSRIIAVEPDPSNFERCRENLSQARLRNAEVMLAGLGEKSGWREFFYGNGTSSSFDLDSSKIEDKNARSVQTRVVALDDIADDPVGFIKMDIEGGEYGALHGAERTIKSNKPLLAISVYHKPGDMLAIMDYLHILVPEYHFWLRHYGPMMFDTVCYCAVPT